MIKRIIFDLDNTLIMWKSEYDAAIKESVEHFGVNVNYKELSKEVDNYEFVSERYNKKELIDYLNSKFDINLNIDFIDYWLPRLGKMSAVSNELKDTLEYLANKYELVVLTNWFTECQKDRLKHASIDKYFKEVYGGEINKKPSKESFLRAIGDRKIDECLMVGDSYTFDIKPAMDLGIKTILVNNKYDNIESIDDINKLREML